MLFFPAMILFSFIGLLLLLLLAWGLYRCFSRDTKIRRFMRRILGIYEKDDTQL